MFNSIGQFYVLTNPPSNVVSKYQQ